MTQTIRVNFGKPLPLFEFPATILLPHAVQPLHIFEPRYRQLVEDCLDAAGQIAMASFQTPGVSETEMSPELRPVVCVGQIVHHEKLPDGRHKIWLHGVCRARIEQTIEADDVRFYRMAKLAPVDSSSDSAPPLDEIRKMLRHILSAPRMQRLRGVEHVLQWFDRDEVPTHALLELVGFTLVQDSELRYDLLAEASPVRRAGMIRNELELLDRLVAMADRQSYKEWPKGLSWN